MLSCERWVDPSGRLGRLNTSLRQLRLLRRGRERDEYDYDTLTALAEGAGLAKPKKCPPPSPEPAVSRAAGADCYLQASRATNSLI
jgi:hypothetical protein